MLIFATECKSVAMDTGDLSLHRNIPACPYGNTGFNASLFLLLLDPFGGDFLVVGGHY